MIGKFNHYLCIHPVFSIPFNIPGFYIVIHKIKLIEMKKLLVFSLVYILLSSHAFSQCNCKQLPAPSGKVIIVNNVTELQNALSSANANNGNTTILLNKGIYILNSNLLYIGSNMSHLSIRGATGNRDDVTIKGQGMNGGVTHIFNVASSNFTLADMTIGWVFYHPIQIHGESNADSAFIHNVRIVDGNEQFIKISGSSTETNIADNGIIECCSFEFSSGIGNQYYTGGVDGHHCSNWIVRNNTFKHLRSPDGNLAEHAIHFWSNSRDIICENNLIIDCDRGIGYGLGDDPTRGNFGGIIRNNFVHTSRDVGIGIERTPDVKIYNNTVWTDNYFNSIEYRFTNTINTHIANNLTNKSIGLREGASGLVENNFNNAINSMFVDATNHDYHLASANVNLIGKGKPFSDVIVDFDCKPRGNTNDIGADQYIVITNNNEINKHELHLFPNPATTFISINNSGIGDPLIQFKLFNCSGKLILEKNADDMNSSIPLESLAPGIYPSMIVSRNGFVYQEKLVIIN